MLSAILLMRRFLGAMRLVLRDDDFGRILAAGALIVIGTLVYTFG